MTAVTEAALARLSASTQNSSSTKLSFAGNTTAWIMNASLPRTLSRTRTIRLPSEKRSTSLRATSVPSAAQMEAVKRGLPLPAKICRSSNMKCDAVWG